MSGKKREYFIDWLRIILIFSVFFYHIGMVFNSWGWHIKNDQQIELLSPVMAIMHLWRMPMLFMISGIATSYALGKRTGKEYFKERSIRILFPLIVGIFVLVPVQVYIEKSNEYSSLWHLYPDFMNGIYPEGNFSLHHLWFLLYLYVIALILIPFISYFGSENFSKKKYHFVLMCNKKLGMNWIIIPLFATQLILRQYFPEKNSHLLINDWGNFVYYLFYFFLGYTLFTNKIMVQKVVDNRIAYLFKTFILLILLFIYKYIPLQKDISIIIKIYIEIIFTWSCIMMFFGYAKIYMNKDNKYRAMLNEGIYPFYLLQQPAIVLIGYFVLKWETTMGIKILLLIILSLLFIISLYFIFIKQLKILRLMFGLKINL